MRAHIIFPALPRNPLLRMLLFAGTLIAILALLALGLVVGIGVVAVAAGVLAVRRWRLRRPSRPADPSIIEGDFTVVPSRPPERLPRPE